MEKWRDVAEYENFYQVSDLGNVRSVDRWVNAKGGGKRLWKGHMLILDKRSDGYEYAKLSKNSVKTSIHVAILVAKAFPETCGEWFDGAQVDHINTDRSDNRAVNIRVCTRPQNNNNPLTKQHMSEAHKGKHLSEETKRKLSEALKGKKSHMCGKFGAEHHNSKPVLQYTKEGVLIREWDSTMDVQRQLGICRSNISECCSGRYKSAGGYKWKYK